MLPRQDSNSMLTGTRNCRCNGVGHCWLGQLLHVAQRLRWCKPCKHGSITVSRTNRAILTGCRQCVHRAHAHEGVSGTVVPWKEITPSITYLKTALRWAQSSCTVDRVVSSNAFMPTCRPEATVHAASIGYMEWSRLLFMGAACLTSSSSQTPS